MREGIICRCPECKHGDIIALDNGLFTCTSCNKDWEFKELYNDLWLSRLQKLMERRLRMQDINKVLLADMDEKIDLTRNQLSELNDYLFLLGQTSDDQKLKEVKQTLHKTEEALNHLLKRRDELSSRTDIFRF